MEHQSYGRVSQAFHLRGTVRSTYVELCVPYTWDCVFHIRGTVCSTYVELYVPPTWDDVSYTWSRAFHLLELCVPYTGTVRFIYWNCVFQSMELCWNTASAADEVGIGRVSLRVVPRL